MRRFVDTMAGKALCHLAVMALVVPTVTLTVAGRAEAQVQQLPSWAVTEFKDLHEPTSKYGTVAGDAVAGELAKTNRYDVVSQETVKRSIETLGLTSPPEGLANLSRIGLDVRATTIIQGEILDYQVREVSGGKQAIVALRLVAYDVASVAPVNGVIQRGESTVRSGAAATNDVLIADAINQAAAEAVRTMQGQQLPSATVLNTTQAKALINQGSRAGFKGGDTVIITRGPLQVGTGRVGDVEFDQSSVTPERVRLGIAPGDRVRTVYSPPPIPKNVFNNDGTIKSQAKGRGKSNNATLISALLVVGLIAVLLSSGNSNKQTVTSSVRARATFDTQPGVRIEWSQNAFAGGNQNQRAWQIYRDDNLATPLIVVRGEERSANDGGQSPTTGFTSYTVPYAVPRPNTCINTTYGGTLLPTPRAGVIAGRSYRYLIELIFATSTIDQPTAGEDDDDEGTGCFGISSRSSSGTVTPINRPGLTSIETSLASGVIGITIAGVRTASSSRAIEYVVEFSTDQLFSKGNTVRLKLNSAFGTSIGNIPRQGFDVTSPNGDLKGSSKSAAGRIRAGNFFYRIGARGADDAINPVSNPTATNGNGYIYSDSVSFTRGLAVPTTP